MAEIERVSWPIQNYDDPVNFIQLELVLPGIKKADYLFFAPFSGDDENHGKILEYITSRLRIQTRWERSLTTGRPIPSREGEFGGKSYVLVGAGKALSDKDEGLVVVVKSFSTDYSFDYDNSTLGGMGPNKEHFSRLEKSLLSGELTIRFNE